MTFEKALETLEHNLSEIGIKSIREKDVIQLMGSSPPTAVLSYVGYEICLLYTSPSPRDRQKSRMPSSA